MTEIIIAGESFNIIVEGDAHAPAVVLSHALGTNLHLFDKQVAALRRHFRVVRYDARGHGRSVVSHGPYSISQLGHDALAIFDALNLEKVHWIGHSEGGMVGLWLLTKAPDRIERAILANTAAQIGGAEVWNERIRTIHEKGIEALAPIVLENWFTRRFREHHPEEVRRFEEALLATNPEGYAASCAAIRDADLRGGLAAIARPVLVMVGRHDPVTPPGVGALIASSIPGAKLVTLEAAHLSPVEAAESFNQAAVEFLSGKAEKTMQAQEARPDDIEDNDNEQQQTAPEPAAEEAPKKPRRPRAPRPKPQPAAAESSEPSASMPEPAPAEEPHAAMVEPTPARAAPRRRAARKSPVKKAPVRKAAAKKAAPKKRGRKVATRKSAAKKSTARRGAVKRPARKPVRKTTAKKRPARRSPAKRPQPKKSATRKSAVRRRQPGRRSLRRRR